MSTRQFIFIFLLFLVGFMFFPYYDKNAEKVNCRNVPDGTGGYNPICEKSHVFTSFYKQHIAR